METASFYSENQKFYVAVDCIIFSYHENKLKVLLQKRNFDPFKGELSLMGGFVKDNESVKEAALRVLEERTGIKDVYIKQVGAFGDVERDPGARVISVAYTALVYRQLCNDELNKQNYGFWANVDEMPPLYFDHMEMVEKAHQQLKESIGNSPICFNMLPHLFTLGQLQSLYEAILGEPLDKRNFRKRVAEMSFIQKTDKIDKNTSKRGAALYKFNEDEYNNIKNFKL